MNQFFLSQISKSLNAILALDSASAERLKILKGKIIRIELLPFHFKFECCFDESGMTVQQNDDLVPDVSLSGTPLQLMNAVIEKEHRHQFFFSDLKIEGNASVAQHITALLDQLDIDWQEYAANIFGDTAVHHANQLFKQFTNWINTANQHFVEDVHHYIHDEKNWLPTRDALQDFFNEVDNTRMAIDRAEAKFQYISQLLKDEMTS